METHVKDIRVFVATCSVYLAHLFQPELLSNIIESMRKSLFECRPASSS